ncbi:Retrotrans gag domain-containing protein [Abeliophyllum distichum]|uniref:Retrotrans gag domain-containing protein n=1 Tax=Abeliophyllum distichum TaxID=126358 RepID=A0ABD1UQ16_9LAMI
MTVSPPATGIPTTEETEPAVEIPPVAEVPPAIEVLPSETMQTRKMTSTSRYSIPSNGESLLNEKIDDAIAWRKNRRRPISIKEDSFMEELMNVPLPLKFKKPTGDFDGMTDPIDHIRTFQDRVRLHGWLDAIACRAFPMTLHKDAKVKFNTLPPRSIFSFSDFANKFAIYFSSSAKKKKTCHETHAKDTGERIISARIHVTIQQSDVGHKKLVDAIGCNCST